jgi:nicotinic acid phosphoribosyltransferase
MKSDTDMAPVALGGRALFTDLYQLTMAFGYWKPGRAEREAVFQLFFRHSPFQCGFTLTAGLAPAIEFFQAFQFTADDLALLGTLRVPRLNCLVAASTRFICLRSRFLSPSKKRRYQPPALPQPSTRVRLEQESPLP